METKLASRSHIVNTCRSICFNNKTSTVILNQCYRFGFTVEQDFHKICNIVLFWCKAKSGPSFVTVVTITVKRVLSGNPLGMAYWPLNTGLTNVRVIIENEGSQSVKYLPHDKLTITFSTSSWNKRKNCKTTWHHTQCDLLHCYGTSSQSHSLIDLCHAVAFLSQEIGKALFTHRNGRRLTKVYRGEDNTTEFVGTSEKVATTTLYRWPHNTGQFCSN